jgi:hypothetical protein
MKLFKKKEGSIKSENVTGKFVQFIIKTQTAFARLLDKKINSMALKRKKFLLYSLIVLTSIHFLFLIVSPFIIKEQKPNIEIDAINFPKHFEHSGEARSNEMVIAVEEYNRIHSFKLYMDSLSKDVNGKKIYDSIISLHPKLMDSVRLLEELYRFQK